MKTATGASPRKLASDTATGSAPPSEPSAKPRASLDDPAALWAVLMADVGHHNAAAWLDHFELRAIDTQAQPANALLAPKPSAGHALRFATAPRLERLSQHLTRLSGTPVRVTLAAPPTSQQRDDQRVADAGSAAPSRQNPGGVGAIDRRDALGLPLVRDAFDVFPDAILVDARKEEITPPPGETGQANDGAEPDAPA